MLCQLLTHVVFKRQSSFDRPLFEYPAYGEAIRLLAAKPMDNHDEPVLRWLDIGTGSGLLASLVAAASVPASVPASTTVAPAATATATAQEPPEPAAQQSLSPATSKSPPVPKTTKTEVYACEIVEEVADVAAETFAKNGGNVRLFRGRSTEMEVGRDLPSRVPRVVSELLGTGRSFGWFRPELIACDVRSRDV